MVDPFSYSTLEKLVKESDHPLKKGISKEEKINEAIRIVDSLYNTRSVEEGSALRYSMELYGALFKWSFKHLSESQYSHESIELFKKVSVRLGMLEMMFIPNLDYKSRRRFSNEINRIGNSKKYRGTIIQEYCSQLVEWISPYLAKPSQKEKGLLNTLTSLSHSNS